LNADLLQGFYLSDLLIEPTKGRVTGREGSERLASKAVEVLLCLAAQPGELVTREELLETVWGKDAGSTEALSHAIGEIRHALHDHHDDPVYIQTLPKRGYRLLVTPAPADGDTGTVVLGAKNSVGAHELGLFENLKQRGVLETGLAYLIVGWLLIQIADIVFSQLLLPQWVGTFVTVLVIAGFPIAIALSWFLEFRDGRTVIDVLSPRDARRRRFSRTYMSVIGALGIAAILVFIYDRSIGLPDADTPAVSANLPPIEENSIGVLPFLPLDPSEKTEIFSSAVAEDVIDSLSRVPGLLVASRGDSFTLEPNSPSARVRERLRVAMYVEGSVQIDNDEMRVVVQLVDSKTGFHVLSRTFDRPLGDYFAMRDEITELAVANVRVALPPETRVVPTDIPTKPDIDVYIAYRRGIEASRKPDVKGWIDDALKWFDAALANDPDYAAAHAGKCDAYVEAYIWLHDETFIAAAESSCRRALSLNPRLDVVYNSLGDLFEATGRFIEAEEAYRDALKIYPDSVAALIGLGEVNRQLQRPKEAEASLKQAIGLHPGDWSAHNALGTFLFRSGRFVEAAEQYEAVVALDGTNARGHNNLATALVLAEEFEAAEPAYRRALELEPSSMTYSNFGLLLYNLGRFDESVEMHRKAVVIEDKDYMARSNLGDALWAAGSRTQSRVVFAEAEDLAIGALEVNPNDAFTMMDLAWIKTALEKHDEADELIDRAMRLVPDDPYVHYIQGIMRNRRGDTASSLHALEIAIDLGYSTRLLSIDPNLSNLHEDAGFNDLIKLSE
jgi:tetratricopeptide (TPR) repeat protein/TolB-like protein/DNA-binding winged helix-turn-helix (wHTH) protein